MKPFIPLLLATLLPLSADTIVFSGDDWTSSNHGRTFIGGGGDDGWTIFDDGSNGNASRQQWIWMDVSSTLGLIPAGHFIDSATLSFPNVEDQDNDGDTVAYSLFDVPDPNRGRDVIIAGGATLNHDGDDVLDYVTDNAGYGPATGVTSATLLEFDISTLVARWHSGSISTNPGQMMLLWDTRGGNRNYVRFVPSGADNGNGDALERPTLTIETTTTPPPNSNPPTSISISRDSLNLAGAISGNTLGILSNDDPDPADNHTYALVAGAGDTDNASFAIAGSDLNFASNLTAGVYSVRVLVTDLDLNSYAEVLTLTIIDNQAPTAPSLAGGFINLNGFNPQIVGAISADDPNLAFSPTDSLTYALVSGAGDTDNAHFFVDPASGQLTFDGPLTEGATFEIRFSATDSTNLSTEATATVNVIELLGADLSDRGSSTDGQSTVFFPNNVPMSDGKEAQGVAVYIQNAADQEGAFFKMFLLRPGANADEFDVVYDSGDIMVTGGATGGTSLFSFPNGPITVQAGDIFAHYGRGIPYSGGATTPIYWPVDAPPLEGENIILGATGTYPYRDDLSRDYAWSIVLTGAAPSEGLNPIISQSGSDTTLDWNASPGKSYRVEGSPDLIDWTDVISASVSGGTHTFPTPAATKYFFRVIQLP